MTKSKVLHKVLQNLQEISKGIYPSDDEYTGIQRETTEIISDHIELIIDEVMHIWQEHFDEESTHLAAKNLEEQLKKLKVAQSIEEAIKTTEGHLHNDAFYK